MHLDFATLLRLEIKFNYVIATTGEKSLVLAIRDEAILLE